jgi:hypothetical protein
MKPEFNKALYTVKVTGEKTSTSYLNLLPQFYSEQVAITTTVKFSITILQAVVVYTTVLPATGNMQKHTTNKHTHMPSTQLELIVRNLNKCEYKVSDSRK